MNRRQNILLPILLAGGMMLTASTLSAGDAELKFEFDAKKYGQRHGNSSIKWPRYCTVLMKVSNDSKPRPLYAYGRNVSGVMGLSLDNVGGLDNRYKISTKGQAKVLVDRYSVTRALDAPSIAATDWVEADPHPGIVLSIDKLTDWKPRDRHLKELLSTSGAWTEEKMKSLRPKFDVKLAGSLNNGKKSAPFTAPATVMLGQGRGYFFMTIDVKVSIKGDRLGLSGSDRKENLTLFFTTTTYSLPPQSLAPPGAGDIREAPTLDMDLDL